MENINYHPHIPKQGRNSSTPENYHSDYFISSWLCKTMEHMVNIMVYWIQQPNYQLPLLLSEAKDLQWAHVGQIGNHYNWGKYPETTPHSNIFQPEEGVWDHLEVWYNEGSTQLWTERLTA